MNLVKVPARAIGRAIVLGIATVMLGTAMVVTPVAASTATVTTLDLPTGQQYGEVTVTAHVRPAPQPVDGFIP
ncbi:MAG TPA: hypothetical protein VKB00_02525, partial [Candidatus Limnocylindrales bacterium]|nr:hypothetical protein [Candidatus Limnocylindrales bacterium]